VNEGCWGAGHLLRGDPDPIVDDDRSFLGLAGEVLGLAGEVLGLAGEVLGLAGEVLGLAGEVLGLAGGGIGRSAQWKPLARTLKGRDACMSWPDSQG
jgi:hypothetical protein